MATYTCPMHGDVRAADPINCPKCGMRLLPDGTRFALVKHMASRPLHLAAMIAVMVALMAGAMMLMR
jgi:hypothetical protein